MGDELYLVSYLLHSTTLLGGLLKNTGWRHDRLFLLPVQGLHDLPEVEDHVSPEPKGKYFDYSLNTQS